MNRYLIIVPLVAAGLMSAGGALAFYGDGETSSGNVLGAASLDFTLRNGSGVMINALFFNESDAVPGPDWHIEPLKVKKETGLDFDYEAWFEKTGGDDILCGELQLKVRHEGVLVYSGPLSAFTWDAGVISGGMDDWSFEILFDNGDSSFENLSCQFDFVFRGEQIGGAGFYDEERVSNVFAAGEWGADEGDVVINEIMWMGSEGNTADEWIELKNTTGEDIDLTGWEIERAGTGGSPILMIPSGTITAGGYFLIANYDSGASAISDAIAVDWATTGMKLDNGGEVLTLKDEYSNLIDTTPSGAWAKGVNEVGENPKKKSMERNDDPGTGASADDWHTCEDDGCKSTIFWDVEADNYGTPKAANLSENDPTSPDGLRGAGPTLNNEGSEEPADEDEGDEGDAVDGGIDGDGEDSGDENDGSESDGKEEEGEDGMLENDEDEGGGSDEGDDGESDGGNGDGDEEDDGGDADNVGNDGSDDSDIGDGGGDEEVDDGGTGEDGGGEGDGIDEDGGGAEL